MYSFLVSVFFKKNNMYPISQLQQNLENPTFFNNQFLMSGKANILFVEPQLSTKHLYKSFFPFFNLFEGDRDAQGKLSEIYISTALTGIDKYAPELQLAGIHTRLEDEWIKWANIIVFPFTTQDLTEEFARIKELKNCIIAYCVDFNYYELHDAHPYKKFFKKYDAVENNILNCDYCITANPHLQTYILGKLKAVCEEKQINSHAKFYNIPYFIDTQICNYDVEEPPMFKLVRQAAKNPEAIQPVIVEKKKKGRPKKVKAGETTVQTPIEAATAPLVTQVFYEPVNVGIIYSKNYNADYKFYNDALQRLPDNIKLIIIGYDPDTDDEDIFQGVNYEYVKPCSLKIFFKQLYSLKLDFCLIPLMDSEFNVTSECLGRYMECGMFGIPILAPNIFPYQAPIIREGDNGFLFTDKNHMVEKLKYLSSVMPFVRHTVSAGARKDVLTRWLWSTENKKHWLMGFNQEDAK